MQGIPCAGLSGSMTSNHSVAYGKHNRRHDRDHHHRQIFVLTMHEISPSSSTPENHGLGGVFYILAFFGVRLLTKLP